MLKPAYFYTNKDELDRLIYDENCYEYITLLNYDDFDQVEISKDDWIKFREFLFQKMVEYLDSSVLVGQKKMKK